MNCFMEIVYYGKETTLFIFEFLLFLFLDSFSQNFVLAAVITFIVSIILAKIRSDLGKRNISKKSLVDFRFLN